jgi:hypothetical protein
MCKKSFTFKLIKGESNCVLSLGIAELSNNTHILQLLGEIIKIEPNEKCKLLFIGKKRAKITLEDIYYLSNLLRCLIGSVFTWDIIGDKLFSNDQDDLDGYLIIGEE